MADTNDTPLVHTVDAACYRLSCGRTRLYSLFNQGRIRPIKVGRRTLVPESELQRFIAESLADADGGKAVEVRS